MIADPRLHGVSVTGSERAGAAVAEIAGRNLKKVVLEMGGSDPFIVLGTEDLDATVKAASEARLDNTGQSCNAAKRFIVVDEYYDDFVEKLSASLGAAKGGDPTAEDTEIGPLSSQTAADRLEEQVKRAVEEGAEVVVGGKPRRQLLRADRPHRHRPGLRGLPGRVLRPGGPGLQGRAPRTRRSSSPTRRRSASAPT